MCSAWSTQLQPQPGSTFRLLPIQRGSTTQQRGSCTAGQYTGPAKNTLCGGGRGSCMPCGGSYCSATNKRCVLYQIPGSIDAPRCSTDSSREAPAVQVRERMMRAIEDMEAAILAAPSAEFGAMIPPLIRQLEGTVARAAARASDPISDPTQVGGISRSLLLSTVLNLDPVETL